MKRLISLLLAFIVLLINPSQSSADIFDESKVIVRYNGVEQDFNPKAVIWNNYTLVPFRQIFELYGAKVGWDKETCSVLATKDDTEIKIVTGSRTAYNNGQTIELAQGPVNAKGTILVGLRFVSEALGAKVSFDKKSLIIDIITE
jgi:hypothetical protein